jgi:hypothetical protein
MFTSTSFRDSILKPGSAEIGLLFPTPQVELVKFLFRRVPADIIAASANGVIQASSQDQGRVIPDVLVRLPSILKSKWKVRVLQQWVGRVEQVNMARFIAYIVDATNSRNPAEQVEFDLSEVSESDRVLVAAGAVFYWSIGYRDTPGGQRERISALRFARHPRFSEGEVNRIFEQADRLATLLESD